MHIKSKMLLPPDPNEVKDEEEMDPRMELVQRLLEYKKFKEAAGELYGDGAFTEGCIQKGRRCFRYKG